MTLRLGALALIVLAPAGVAQPRPIDVGASVIRARVFKSGLLSAFGHNHEITARIVAGSLDAANSRVEFHTLAASLRVQDSGISEQDRMEIQKTMQGPEVLDLNHFPDISFRSTSAEAVSGSSWAESSMRSIRYLPQLDPEPHGHMVGSFKAQICRPRQPTLACAIKGPRWESAAMARAASASKGSSNSNRIVELIRSAQVSSCGAEGPEIELEIPTGDCS